MATQDLSKLRLELVPAEYADHPLVRNQVYFVLPRHLVDRIVQAVGLERFDDQLLQMEYDLSEFFKAGVVGFWAGNLVHFPWLQSRPIEFDEDFAEWALKHGWERKHLDSLAQINERTSAVDTEILGYAGWLMANPLFLQEHQALFSATSAVLTSKYGIPRLGSLAGKAAQLFEPVELTPEQVAAGVENPPYEEIAVNEAESAAIEQWAAFFERWRLAAMPAPFLPVPKGPHAPAPHLAQMLGHMGAGGQMHMFRDTMPLPSRETMRGLIENALRSDGDLAHLKEWTEIIQSGNRAKNQIPRFARIFLLQHFYRAFCSRHCRALKGKKQALLRAFAGHFRADEKTIDRDLVEITRRLGTDWQLS